MEFTPVIAFSKGVYLLIWKLVEYTFNHQTYLCKRVRYERSKHTVTVSQDLYKIPSCWNNLFQDKQIICLRQADYMRRNSLLINVSVQAIYQTLCNSNGNSFSLIPHVCYCLCLTWVAASEVWNLTTLFFTKMKDEEIATRASSFSHSVRVPSSPRLCKNHKKPQVDKKIQACETLTLTEGFGFSRKDAQSSHYLVC